MKKLRAGDPIMVIAGKHKGKVSSIQSFVDADYVMVKGVNEMKKAVKGKGFIKKQHPIHVSNVMYYVEAEKKPSRIKISVDKKGKKVREAKKFKLALK